MRSVMMLLLFVSYQAHAECRREWVCGHNNIDCEVKQVCDSPLDLPAINLPGLKPIGITPIEPVGIQPLPPLGTSECTRRFVRGRWISLCE